MASINRLASIQTLGATSMKPHNSIHNLEIKWFRNDTGEFPAIVMGLSILDEETAGDFIDHVIDEFKGQRAEDRALPQLARLCRQHHPSGAAAIWG